MSIFLQLTSGDTCNFTALMVCFQGSYGKNKHLTDFSLLLNPNTDVLLLNRMKCCWQIRLIN